LEQQSQRLDNLELRLKNHAQRILSNYRNRLERLVIRQKPLHPERKLAQLQERFKQAQQGLVRAQNINITQKQQRFAEAVRMLNTLSPLKTLDRGYALASLAETQTPITNSQQLKPGDKVKTQVAKGEFVAVVESITP
jgi:exodeoxyribonuclease VII large subunit